MRTLIGSLVLIAGVGGLGYVATARTAVRIEADITAAAQAAISGFTHAPRVQVSGRDLALLGTATDTSEVAALRSAVEAVSGVRRIDVSGLDTLPIADPYELQIERMADGALRIEGVMPSDAARTVFDDLPDGSVTDVTLASGAPDDAWADVVAQAALALAALQTGTAALSDHRLTISGTAEMPQDVVRMREALGALPDGYTLQEQIETLDDGAPFVLSATLQGGTLMAAGKFPAGVDPAAFAEQFGLSAPQITQAVIPARVDGWDAAAHATFTALGALIEGEATLEENRLTLTGVGSPDGIEQAAGLIAALPQAYEVTTDLSVYGADFELRLSMEWDGTTAQSTGTYPAEFTPRGPAGVALSDSGEVLFLPDAKGDFTANAHAGVAALGLLNTGTLIATADRITLTGIATSPRVGISMEGVLALAAPDVRIEQVINYLDDGSPAAWALRYDAQTGAAIEGRLPNGLTSEALGEALGVAQITGSTATAQEDERQGSSLEALAALAAYLPEVEALTFSFEENVSTLDLVMSPGVDIDLVAIDLVESLPVDVGFSVGPLVEMPAIGTLRRNAATGQQQVFEGGFWLPDVQFTTDLAGCTKQTQAALTRDRIGFLSASARLDAGSIRAINALAAVARPCAETGLTFEVGGHTDASGDEDENEILSQDRADAVREALVARGIPASSLTAFGFGQSQPVADNETAEGRTANRRTDIVWFEQGALRDP